MKRIFFILLISVSTFACRQNDQEKGVNAYEFSDIPDTLKINHLQILGTHNSYAKPIDINVMNYAAPIIDGMMAKMLAAMPPERLAEFEELHPNRVNMRDGLSYDHPPMPEQLEAGIRSLEIDVFYDPTGNRFKNPASYRMLRQQGVSDLLPHDTIGLGKPGFKVLHIADFDFRTHCTTLENCLAELKEWSINNEGHLPIFILLEVKTSRHSYFSRPNRSNRL